MLAIMVLVHSSILDFLLFLCMTTVYLDNVQAVNDLLVKELDRQ